MQESKKCKACGQAIIRPPGQRLSEFLKKIFCNRSCAVGFNNGKKPKRVARQGETILCRICGTEFTQQRRPTGGLKTSTRCPKCRLECRTAKKFLPDETKGVLFSVRCNWQSARSSIQKHARRVYVLSGRPMACEVCAYSNHVDIAHRKAVSEFPDEATVKEINDVANLIALCPNHHWEYDNGIPVIPLAVAGA